MATRRSTRGQNLPTREDVDDEQEAPAKAIGGIKEKPQKPAGKTAGQKSTAVKGRASKSQPQPSLINPKVMKSALPVPPEVLSMILDNLKDPSTISKLGRTNKNFYTLMMPRLYHRIAVAAMFHAHIPKLIRTLEPHLSIAQKNQLKKEGKYRGQQERYPTGLDEKAKPLCAGYVRQLVVGVADPGKKHKYIVERYVEEAFKNMVNLEIVETRVVTKSISQSIASFANLKALSLFINDSEPENIEPLARVKNLRHLYLQDNGYYSSKSDAIQSMLRNSRTTLQSLAIENAPYACQFLRDWEKNLKASNEENGEGINEQGHDFSALKSLTLSNMPIDENFIREFQKAIDFTKLRELNLTSFNDSLLYSHLTSVATSYQGTKDTPLSLQSLSLHMSKDSMNNQGESATFEAKCRFISSFDTLTTLKLQNYGQYPSNTIANPGLTDPLLQAILKHKNLRTLKISYTGRMSGFETPYLGAETVGAIVDGLPLLRDFEFAPDEAHMDSISQALLRGSNLQSITCFPHATWGIHPPPTDPGANIISSILLACLSNPKLKPNLTSPPTGNFIWEDHYKLKRVSVQYKTWDVASAFGKRAKGELRPEKIQAEGADGAHREVWYRGVTGPQRMHVGFDPEFEWVDKVDREMQ
ncbi:hypothetical protein LARI1_G001395 [Lachnellula arida]|uniref:F-box domain-containing protein n=1 Tax=Lachnellula arida TaxID=1316785 RepID=A0A8T9BME7_9HELO|nr:hypothetical protein LARI1_G001395 [Lachnellula arida]